MEQQANLHITDRLWNFVEANVPNYHEREDVLRHAELQLFIDGHESSVQGITREEAQSWRDRILFRLYHEAIDHFTSKLPIPIFGESSLRNYAEALVDIAYECGYRHFYGEADSRARVSRMIGWADEFCELHAKTDWSQIEYLDTIDSFIHRKLGTNIHHIQHRCSMCQTNMIELQYSDSDTNYLSIRCPSCGVFLENEHALAAWSGVTTWNKEMYGEPAQQALKFLLHDSELGIIHRVIHFDMLKVSGVYQSENKFIAFDNRCGDCYVEEFRLLNTAVKWIKGEMEIEDRAKYE